VTPLSLNLGCGPDYRAGWLNVDADPAVRVDAHADVTDHAALDALIAARPIALIYMKHVLEHLPMAAVPPHLAWCHRTLAPGGQVVIDGPDLRAMCLRLAMQQTWTWDDVAMIYGGQGTAWDRHLSGWGADFLTTLLRQAGFVEVAVQRVDLCSVVTGRKADA
jgi:predicted SAM-dependent methyltransferase